MAVVTRIRSGLGNQLFCYAAGRALAHRLGTSLIVDCRDPDRPVYLDRYAVDARFLRDGLSNVRGYYAKLQRRYGTVVAELHRLFPRSMRVDGQVFRVFEERHLFTYGQEFGSVKGAIYLNGYWQSFRYSSDVEPIIRAELQPKADLTEPNRRWLEAIRNRGNSICVHVRRGDYLKTAFGLCSPEYYKNAAAVMRERVGNDATFFVFSDDLPWCRDQLPIKDPAFIEGNEDDPVSELCLMAACRHHIIANSTFSWWAAWLGRHEQQVVIAPEPWISTESHCPDLIPLGWTKLAR
jgi:hypothetical protein